MSIMPGVVDTGKTPKEYKHCAIDNAELCGAASLYILSNPDKINSGYTVGANWDLPVLSSLDSEAGTLYRKSLRICMPGLPCNGGMIF